MALIFGFAFSAIAFRPAYVSVMTSVNSSFSNAVAGDTTALRSMWATVNTAEGMYWTVPILGILLILLWIYMSAQKKEYVSAGLYG
jgi:hypothetical protein